MVPGDTHVLVIGQGYVGLPLSCALAEAGFMVTGYDLNKDRVATIQSGDSGLDEDTTHKLQVALQHGLRVTADLAPERHFDVVVVCVPTPPGLRGEVDLSAVMGATRDGAAVLKPGGLFILESTSFPGTTEEYVMPVLQEHLGEIDSGFLLAFSPERIDPGNPNYTISNTPRVVGGVSAQSAEAAASFYRTIVSDVVVLKGAKEAEMAKLLENTYRQVNIALSNELAKVSHELGIDYWDVVRGAATKPYGFQAFYPGPGVGGHCIPIDPMYLNERVRDLLGRPLEFVELAQEVNNGMPRYVARRVIDLLANRGIEASGAKVLLLGATYKANVGDRRGAPIEEVFEALDAAGCEVSYHDPFCETLVIPGGSTVHSVADVDQALAENDVVVLLQAHQHYLEPGRLDAAAAVFDTRGVLFAPNVERL